MVASPAVAWQIHARVVDFQVALASQGVATVHLPPLPPERLVYPSDVHQARFVIIDRIWRNWAAPRMPAVQKMMAEVETWPVAWHMGEFQVYQNPALASFGHMGEFQVYPNPALASRQTETIN